MESLLSYLLLHDRVVITTKYPPYTAKCSNIPTRVIKKYNLRNVEKVKKGNGKHLSKVTTLYEPQSTYLPYLDRCYVYISHKISNEHLLHLRNCTVIKLPYVLIDDDALPYFTNCEVLMIKGSQITGTGFIHLTKLRELDCTQCHQLNLNYLESLTNLELIKCDVYSPIFAQCTMIKCSELQQCQITTLTKVKHLELYTVDNNTDFRMLTFHTLWVDQWNIDATMLPSTCKTLTVWWGRPRSLKLQVDHFTTNINLSPKQVKQVSKCQSINCNIKKESSLKYLANCKDVTIADRNLDGYNLKHLKYNVHLSACYIQCFNLNCEFADLSGTNVSDDDLVHINAKKLNIVNTHITSRGIRYLQQRGIEFFCVLTI